MSDANATVLKLLKEAEEIAPAGFYAAMHITFAYPTFSHSTYPKEWIEEYAANSYALRDPAVLWGFTHSGVKRWSQLRLPDIGGVMKRAKKHGLVYGCTVSLGPMTGRSIMSLGLTDREFTDEELLVCQRIASDLHKATDMSQGLTEAQKEAFRLLAKGMRRAEAANELGISESAFKHRIADARKRMKARTTAEALQKARDARLL